MVPPRFSFLTKRKAESRVSPGSYRGTIAENNARVRRPKRISADSVNLDPSSWTAAEEPALLPPASSSILKHQPLRGCATQRLIGIVYQDIAVLRSYGRRTPLTPEMLRCGSPQT